MTISYWDHSEPTQETIIATQPQLLKMIPATVTWAPIEAAAPAIAAMKAGSFDIITGVGNPPVVSAIVNGSAFKVIWLGSFDAVKLVVRSSIAKPSDLAGKTIADLVGSSQDYALRGWLGLEHLQNKVTILGLSGMETPVAAFRAHRIDGAYVNHAQAAEMIQAGGHVLMDSVRIAKLGYAGINVSIARLATIRQHPEEVQGYVCAAVAVTKLMESARSTRDAAYKAAAALTGQSPAQAVQTGEQDLIDSDVRLNQELSYFKGTNGSVATSPIVLNYLKTMRFLVTNGSIHRSVSASTIASYLDTRFVQKALGGGC
jgi:ABC-type taurine transport system substrate-binding protein